ncbi:desmocollin 2-like protein [Latimeria chalumnae]|uniref:desmocollin 2-like protein n=1 Tax=Latimeria chalumnae TaxID=7897 RepID=UPI00313B60E4
MNFTGGFFRALAFVVSLSFCKACLPEKMDITVSSELEAGEFVMKVNLQLCPKTEDLHINLNDSDFTIRKDGSVYTVQPIKIAPGLKTFSVLFQDPNTLQEWKTDVTLSTIVQTATMKRKRRDVLLQRSKRRWRPLPFSIKENSLGPFPEFLQEIRTEFEQNDKVRYSISGRGVDLPPVGLFSVEAISGKLFIHNKVDREEYPVFELIGFAQTEDGYNLELPLDITIKVVDDNDNIPVFTESVFHISVPEHSKVGTAVGNVSATDRDEAGTLNTKLKYRILQSTSPRALQLFTIDQNTGLITTLTNSLDREVQDNYVLILEVWDMDGDVYGLSSTGSVSICVSDINDNPPTFKSPSYSVEINENENYTEILRIPVDDKDLINTSNWRAKFTILKGNENGNFKIETDPQTNEGVLYVIKALDYEAGKKIDLEVAAKNEAELVGSKPSKATTSVTVNVKDVDEGPEFIPGIKFFRVNDGLSNGTVIGEYKATDPDTKTSDGIRYQKISDPASWVSIDANTGSIKTTNIMDRESSFVKNDQYNVTVLATDASSKTGTGIIVIHLIDENDHNPTITTTRMHICKTDNGKNHAVIKAEDPDATPNGAPFRFFLPDDPPEVKKNWKITYQGDTYAHLEEARDLRTGSYEVPVIVLDQQGQGEGVQQKVTVMICNCADNENCSAGLQESVILGIGAILAMLLALLLLLCLLLVCFCGTQKGFTKNAFFDDGAQQHLIVSNTEGPGEKLNLESGGLRIPLQTYHDSLAGHGQKLGFSEGNMNMHGGMNVHGSTDMLQNMHVDMGLQNNTTIKRHVSVRRESGSMINVNQNLQMDADFDGGAQQCVEMIAYLDWQELIEDRLEEKVMYMNEQEENANFSSDIIKDYKYEGSGSPTGSLHCCSDIIDEDRLDFLNQLGPKFRTLAEICTKK